MNYQMNNPYSPYSNYYNMPQTSLYGSNFNDNRQKVELTRVNGLDGAKAYQMPQPDSTVALFDANDDYFYVKQTDGAGFPTIKKYSFVEVVDNTQDVTSEDWISREEFEQFKKEVMDIGKQFIRYSKQDNGTEQRTDNKQ